MPPKKRQRVSQAASPEASLPPDTPAQANAAADPKEEDQDDEGGKGNATVEERELAELWTDSEEIGLFKGIMRWKPTGIHKHFRILALHNWLLQNNHITPGQRHTSPAGIRAKLKTLYDLEALDAREDARQLSKMVNPLLTEEDKAELSSSDDDDSHAYSEAANKIETSVFALPKDEDFARLMWRQRFADPTKDEEEDVATGIEGGDEAQHQQQKKRRGGGAHNGGRRTRKSTSPLGLAELNLADDPPIIFTPSFSVEPSDAPTPAPKPSGRGGRGGSGRGRGRGGSRAAAAAASGPKRRSTRQAESNADEASSRGDKEDDNDEDEVEDGGEEEEGGEDDDEEGDGEEGDEDGDGAEGDEDDGEDNEDDEDDDDENQSQTSTPVPRSTRSSRSKRGRGTASSSAAASRRTRKRQR